MTVIPIEKECNFKQDYNNCMQAFMTMATAEIKGWEQDQEEAKTEKVED